jgi:hypothetical protein
MHIDGSCHCGNISFKLAWPLDATEIPARACGCSFCSKHAGVWTAHPGASLKVSIRDRAQVSDYRFDTGTAVFHTCRRCGVVPLVTSRIDERLYAVVSVHAFDNVAASMIRPSPATFDDEDTATRLARRQRHWVPDVEFVEGRG